MGVSVDCWAEVVAGTAEVVGTDDVVVGTAVVVVDTFPTGGQSAVPQKEPEGI